MDHVLGVPLFMPVTVRPGSHADTPGPIEALLEDGRDVGARLVWIGVAPDADEHARWLAPAGKWTAAETPDDPSLGTTQGFWAVVARLPIDAAGQGLWVAGTLVELNWLATSPLEAGDPSLGAIAAVFPEAAASPGFGSLIEPERASPARRWRASLAIDGLSLADPVSESSSGTGSGAEDPNEAEPLAALAAQQEARWATGLLRLHHDDPDVCAQVRRSICAVASFDAGILAPVWSGDDAALDVLLSALLDPASTPRSRVRAATLHLNDQPIAACWIVDDAGRMDADAALATIGLANLSERSTLAWAAATNSDVAPSLEPLRPRQTMQTTTAAARSSVAGLGEVSAHVGRWGASRTTLSEPLNAAPPGLRVGPLAPGWTLAQWLAGSEPRPGSADAPWATAGLLERLPGSDGAWTLYVECLRPPDSANDADSVRVWLGPLTRPSAVIRVTRDGSVRDEIVVDSDVRLIGAVRASPDRWSFRVELPGGAIPRDGVLMIGLERIAPGARRWSWPRPMMPWQVEPGRVRVNLRAWEGLGG